MGERIKEERERLGFSQTEFAALAHATRKTLFNWESGAASPNTSALAVWAEAGLDVLYVITAQRSQVIPPRAALPRDQQALLNSYEMCSATVKKQLLQAAALFASGAQDVLATAQPRVTVTAHGGNAAGRDMKINNTGQERTHDRQAKGGKPARQRSGA